LLTGLGSPRWSIRRWSSFGSSCGVLRGQEPNRQEMQEGIPAGLEDQLAMSGIPFAIGAVAIAMGTGVFSVFSYLNDHEDRLAQQTATPLERGLRALSDNIWGVAAIGAVVGGVYIYHRTQTADEREHRREMETIRESRKGRDFEENPSSDEDEEKDSFIDKAKTFVRNGLFPAEKNPGFSPAERLSEKFERLNEDEQNRFIALINGEEIEEEEEDEPEENPEVIEPETEENSAEPEEEETLEENEEEQDHGEEESE